MGYVFHHSHTHSLTSWSRDRGIRDASLVAFFFHEAAFPVEFRHCVLEKRVINCVISPPTGVVVLKEYACSAVGALIEVHWGSDVELDGLCIPVNGLADFTVLDNVSFQSVVEGCRLGTNHVNKCVEPHEVEVHWEPAVATHEEVYLGLTY